MTPLRLGLVGASGRMGTEILALCHEAGDVVPALGVSRSQATGFGRWSQAIDDQAAREIDVIIDFSLPAATVAVAAWCAKHAKPLVSGVTGVGAAEHTAFASAATKTAVLWSPNMSLGVAVMAQMLKSWNRLKDFEFQIEEVHHKRKKDKPSGTALFLQERLEEAVGGPQPAPLALRGGGVFGIHKAWAMGEEETLTVEHTAMNRRVFARGALVAARWVRSQPAGVYTMADVLEA